MGVRLTNTSVATYDTSVTVEIHDKDGGDDNDTFDILSPGYTIEFLGDQSDIFDNIITSNARCNLIINSDETQSFFDDLIGGNEGRFFVRILVNGAIVFIGKIIQDNITLEDAAEPLLAFTAIDTITDLKSKDFNMILSPFTILSVKDIFSYLINEMPIAWLYPSSGPLWGFQSDIIPNVPSYDGNLMEVMRVHHYFFEEKNREQKVWNCYDVLDELLKRLNCSIRNIYGIFWITGMEGIHSTRLTNLHYYDVNGDFVASTSPSLTSLNIGPKSLAGGVFNYQSGYKRLIWESDKEYSNRGFGSGIYWTLFYPADVTPEFKIIGIADAGLLYKIKVNVNVQSIAKTDVNTPTNEFFYVKLIIKEKRISDNAEVELFDDSYLIPTIVGDYFYEFPVPEKYYDREIIVSVDHTEFDEAFNIDQLVFNVNINLTETGQKYDSIKVISTIEDSTNPGLKEIKTKGNHHNGNDLVKFKYYETLTDGIETTKEFKFSGGSSWIPYEQLITESQLKRLGNTHILEISYNDFWYHDVFHNITYKGVDYYIIGLVHNLHQDTTNFILFKKNGIHLGTITTEEEVPYEIDSNNVVSTIIGNYALLNQTSLYYEEFFDVATNYVTLTDFSMEFEVDVDDTYTINTKWIIYINGVKQRYLNGTLVNRTFKFDVDNNRIYFFKGAGNVAHIEVFKYY